MAPLRQYSHVARIRWFHNKASDSTKQRGQQWYQREHEYALWLARCTGHSPRIICACLAVLSPRCQWSRVKNACASLLNGERPSGIFGHNLAKADEILASQNGILINPKTAPKTWAFWHNLLRPNDPEPVTLDSWMFRAHGLSVKSGISVYGAVADAYREVATELGLIPNQLQATIWLHVKE